jgi:hypothetical protein
MLRDRVRRCTGCSHVASETVPCAGRGDGVGRRRAAAGGAYFLKVTSDVYLTSIALSDLGPKHAPD